MLSTARYALRARALGALDGAGLGLVAGRDLGRGPLIVSRGRLLAPLKSRVGRALGRDPLIHKLNQGVQHAFLTVDDAQRAHEWESAREI